MDARQDDDVPGKDEMTAKDETPATGAPPDQAPTAALPAADPELPVLDAIDAIADTPTEHAPAASSADVPTERVPALAVSELPTQRVSAVPAPTAAAEAATAPGMAESVAAPLVAVLVAEPEEQITPARARKRRHRWLGVGLAVATLLLLGIASIPLVQSLSLISQTASVTATLPIVTATVPTATTTPGPTATRDPHALDWALLVRQRAELGYVNNMIQHMSLDEEIGQMIMMGFLETQISPALLTQLKQYHVGNVVYYAWNIQSAAQTKKLSQDLQANADIPLFIATDQEGGSVNRLLAIDGYLPSAAQMGASNSTSYVKSRGTHDANELIKVGINMNFAPVVDVNSATGILGARTFGSTPSQVTKMAGAYLQGLEQSQQVVGTLKHFPGLGSVPGDPHEKLITFDRSESDLEKIDWAPYKSLLATGQVGAIMSTHVVLSAIDPNYPASLSQKVLTGVLRDKLGFNGVIVTDGIYMEALAAHFSFDNIILNAVKAGNDIICSTYSIQSTAEAERVIHDAVTGGIITKQRIDDSVRRILLLKFQYGVLSM